MQSTTIINSYLLKVRIRIEAIIQAIVVIGHVMQRSRHFLIRPLLFPVGTHEPLLAKVGRDAHPVSSNGKAHCRIQFTFRDSKRHTCAPRVRRIARKEDEAYRPVAGEYEPKGCPSRV